MATKQKKSTTPIADAQRDVFKQYDERCEFFTVDYTSFSMAKCKTCGKRFTHIMSAYAVSKDPNDHLMSCACYGRLVWFKVLGE